VSDTGQVTSNAAEIYDEFFLTALFNQWPPIIIELAGLEPGMRVLDIACGTGVLAIAVDNAVKPNGSVVGLDLNPGMLATRRFATGCTSISEAGHSPIRSTTRSSRRSSPRGKRSSRTS
jgi:ubiquinone/menaquinone biosynthesis C-methylase UbiE